MRRTEGRLRVLIVVQSVGSGAKPPNINRQRTSNDSAVENVSREVMWDVSALG
jgi:hypothetical protein